MTPAAALLTLAERERPALVAISCTGSWVPAAAGFAPPEPDEGRVVPVDSMRELLPVAARLCAAA